MNIKRFNPALTHASGILPGELIWICAHEESAGLASEYLINLGLVMVFTLALNLPFGHLRARENKYSFRWFLFIHLPIPLIYILRKYFMLSISIIPFLVLAAVMGQFWGGKLKAPKIEPQEKP